MNWNLIFGSAVFGSCLGIFGAAINAYFQRRFERRKWHAEFFIAPRIEALRALHSAIVGCQMEHIAIPDTFGALRKWENEEEKQRFYQRIKARYDKLTESILAVSIYIEPSDLATINEYRARFYVVRMKHEFEPFKEFDPDETYPYRVGMPEPLQDQYEKVEARLRQLLYPEKVLDTLFERTGGR
jgi:hypothetical protein